MKNLSKVLLPTVLVCLACIGLLKPSKATSLEPATNEVTSKDQSQDIKGLANANGLNPDERVINAILIASEQYDIDALELTAIGIIETGLGKYAKLRKNKNGTTDRGLFQINTVNYTKCIEYNLDSPEGSALCAAKLLSDIKSHRKDYLGVYHSKNPKHKKVYMQKLSQVLSQGEK